MPKCLNLFQFVKFRWLHRYAMTLLTFIPFLLHMVCNWMTNKIGMTHIFVTIEKQSLFKSQLLQEDSFDSQLRPFWKQKFENVNEEASS